MKFARRRSEEPQIGLTPLIDVVFLLLIFFMVTTSFVHESGLAVTLPQGGNTEPPPTDDTLTVVVDAADGIFLDGERIVGESALRDGLAGRADKASVLRVRADGRASHQTVVSVMDAGAAVGFGRIDIATRRTDEADE